MAGRTPAEAVRAFVSPLQEALGCFADGKVTADSFSVEKSGVLTLNKSAHVPLFGGALVTLNVTLRYQIVQTDDELRGPWKVQTLDYWYDLRRAGHSVVEYHWHPLSGETRPHLHCTKIIKGHIPTGRVMIEDVLNLAIELGAKPRDADRWAELDRINRERFARGATWGAAILPASNDLVSN